MARSYLSRQREPSCRPLCSRQREGQAASEEEARRQEHGDKVPTRPDRGSGVQYLSVRGVRGDVQGLVTRRDCGGAAGGFLAHVRCGRETLARGERDQLCVHTRGEEGYLWEFGGCRLGGVFEFDGEIARDEEGVKAQNSTESEL